MIIYSKVPRTRHLFKLYIFQIEWIKNYFDKFSDTQIKNELMIVVLIIL